MGQRSSKPLVDVALLRDRLRKPCGVLPPVDFRETSFDQVCGGEAALLSQLAALGASTPSCVYARSFSNKVAKASRFIRMDADITGRHITETFTDHELDHLIDDGYNELLLSTELPMFDRAGSRYVFQFAYTRGVASNGFYWLNGVGEEHARFMVNNGNVVQDAVESGKKVVMEMFAFRSSDLLPKDRGFHDHPDGALGMILLFSKSDEDDAIGNQKPIDTKRLQEILGVVSKNYKDFQNHYQKAAH